MTTAPRTDNREKMVYIGTGQKFKIFGPRSCLRVVFKVRQQREIGRHRNWPKVQNIWIQELAADESDLKLDNREKMVHRGTDQKFKIFGSRSCSESFFKVRHQRENGRHRNWPKKQNIWIQELLTSRFKSQQLLVKGKSTRSNRN